MPWGKIGLWMCCGGKDINKLPSMAGKGKTYACELRWAVDLISIILPIEGGASIHGHPCLEV